MSEDGPKSLGMALSAMCFGSNWLTSVSVATPLMDLMGLGPLSPGPGLLSGAHCELPSGETPQVRLQPLPEPRTALQLEGNLGSIHFALLSLPGGWGGAAWPSQQDQELGVTSQGHQSC